MLAEGESRVAPESTPPRRGVLSGGNDDFLIDNGQPEAERVEAAVNVEQPHDFSKLWSEIDRLASLILPTAILSFMSAGIVLALHISPSGKDPFLSILPFGVSNTTNVGLVILEANVNAWCVMAAIVVLTYAFVGMFALKLQKTMNVCVIASFTLAWTAFTGYFLAEVSPAIDWITLILVSLNTGLCGCVAVFIVEKDEWSIGNLFLIYLSAIVTWPFACLPELTVIFVLIWMAIWDVIAVCTPCGPLQYALYLQQKRIWMAESEFVLPRGMVIRVHLYELGLGDLIFFGVVVGRAASVNYETLVSCFVAMLASGVFTVAYTVASGRTIPALPIALALGIATYAMSRFTTEIFVTNLTFQQGVFN